MLIGSRAVFAAVPMRNIFHSAFSEPYVKGAVAGGAKVKSFGLAARLAVVGTASVIAVGVPVIINTSGGDYRLEDKNAPQIISEISEEDKTVVENSTEHKAIEINEPYYPSFDKLSAASKGIIEGRIFGSHKELIDVRDGAVVSETDTDIKNNECVFPYTVYDVEITKVYKNKGELNKYNTVEIKTLGNDSVEFENAVDLETGKSYLFFIDYFDNYSDKYPAWLVSSTQSIYEKNNNEYSALFETNTIQVTWNMLMKGITKTAELEAHTDQKPVYSMTEADALINKGTREYNRSGRSIIDAKKYAESIIDGRTDLNSLEAKSFVYHQMLNSIDYFTAAEGSYTLKLGEAQPVDIKFQTDMEKGISYEWGRQEGRQEFEHYVEDGVKYSVNGNFKTIRKTYIAQSVEYEISDNDRVVQLDNGENLTVLRDDTTNLDFSGNNCLFPQQYAMTDLFDFERWSVTGITQEFDRPCVTIEAEGDNVHYNYTVDLFTGIMVKYEKHDNSGTLTEYIIVKYLTVDGDIKVKPYDEAEYAGKYEITDL